MGQLVENKILERHSIYNWQDHLKQNYYQFRSSAYIEAVKMGTIFYGTEYSSILPLKEVTDWLFEFCEDEWFWELVSAEHNKNIGLYYDVKFYIKSKKIAMLFKLVWI